MSTQTKHRARGANGHDIDGLRAAETGLEGATEAAANLSEQGRDAALAGTRQAQDTLLAMAGQGQDGMLTMARTLTEALGRMNPTGHPLGMLAPAGAAVRGGFNLFEQLLAGQRQFVDRLIAEQRHLTEALLTPRTQR